MAAPQWEIDDFAVKEPVTLLCVQQNDEPCELQELDAHLCYTEREPYSVFLFFDDIQIAWEFSRELLVAGMDRTVGDAAVTISPIWAEKSGRMGIRLQGWSVAADAVGSILYTITLVEVRRFLKLAHKLVAFGSEHEYLNWDAVLQEILDGPVERTQDDSSG